MLDPVARWGLPAATMTESVPDTIFALSSGRPPAAVAVVRISGPHAGTALRALTGKLPAPRQAALVRVRDPQSGEAIDQALALWFPGPASETGEDVAELQIHGGRAVIAATLGALGKIAGLRPAAAGEFARRAFENGKLDLTAVEGLADLVMAETEGQRRQALRQLTGALGRRAEEWRRTLIEALALVEAGIDFADEADVPKDLIEPALALVRRLGDEIAAVLAEPSRGERLREGLTVAIAGPPNAGKSSLLNRIARREAAIVSPHAGTTRDVIEVHLDLDGWPVTLLDTAGIRATGDPVEMEGVRRARARAAAADVVLWVVDAREEARLAVDAGLAGGPSRLRAADLPASGDEAGTRPVRGRSALGDSSPQAGREAATFLEAGAHAIDELLAGAGSQSAAGGSPAIWMVRNKIDLLPPGTLKPGRVPAIDGGGAGSTSGGREWKGQPASAGTPMSAAAPAGGGGLVTRDAAGSSGRPGRMPADHEGSLPGSEAGDAARPPRPALAPPGSSGPVLPSDDDALGRRETEIEAGTAPAPKRVSGRETEVEDNAVKGALRGEAGPNGDDKSGRTDRGARREKKYERHENSSELELDFTRFGDLPRIKWPPIKNEQENYVLKYQFNISAITGEGIDEILALLAQEAERVLAGAESALISRARHRHALEEAAAALRRACTRPLAEDLLAEELRQAARALGRLTGRVDVEEVLDVIFRDFCIGK